MPAYIVSYKLISNLGDPLKEGKIRIKNIVSVDAAHDWLRFQFRKQYKDFGRLDILGTYPEIDYMNQSPDKSVKDLWDALGIK